MEGEKWLILIIHRSCVCELVKRTVTSPKSTAQSVCGHSGARAGGENLSGPVCTFPGETERDNALPSPFTPVSHVL